MKKIIKEEYQEQLKFMKKYAEEHPLVYKQKTIKQVLAERNKKRRSP